MDLNGRRASLKVFCCFGRRRRYNDTAAGCQHKRTPLRAIIRQASERHRPARALEPECVRPGWHARDHMVELIAGEFFDQGPRPSAGKNDRRRGVQARAVQQGDRVVHQRLTVPVSPLVDVRRIEWLPSSDPELDADVSNPGLDVLVDLACLLSRRVARANERLDRPDRVVRETVLPVEEIPHPLAERAPGFHRPPRGPPG